MRAKEALFVQAPAQRDSPAVVRALGGRFIQVHGSTCVLSVPIASPDNRNCCSCDAFTVTPVKSTGMVALTVWTAHLKRGDKKRIS